MSLLHIVVDFLYIVIQEAWYTAAVLAKFFLAGTAVYLVSRNELSLDAYSESILENGKYFIFLVTGLGLMAASLGIEVRPFFSLPSQLIALGYLAYLFWKY